jgi:signal peptidase
VRILVILRETLLTLTAVLGGLSVVALIASAVFQIKPLVVVSGSMEPGIPTGSVILSQKVDVEQIAVGDVVTVPKRTGSALVTHRVVEIADAPGGRELTLRGDANETDDPYAYPVASVGLHRFTIPGAGYVVGWVQSRTGVVVMGALAAAVMILLLGTRGEERVRRSVRTPRHWIGERRVTTCP